MERRTSTIVVLAAAAAVVLALVGAGVSIVVHPVPRSRVAAHDDAGADAGAPGTRLPDDGFTYVSPRVTIDPGPAVLRGELPPLDEQGYIAWDDAHVPRGHVVGRICAGDREMLDRLARATRRVPSALEAAVGYGGPLDDCYLPRACGWAAEAALDAARPETERLLAWWALAGCEDARAEALFGRDDVPAIAYAKRADRASLIRSVNREWNDALGRALLEEVAIARTARGRFYFRNTLSLVANTSGPRAGAALLAAYDASTAYETRTAIAAAMFLQHDRRSVALRSAACSGDVQRQDGFCRWRPLPLPRQPDTSGDLVGALAGGRVTAEELAAASTPPAPARAAALAECVERTAARLPWTAAACLDALAGLDLAAARRLAPAQFGTENLWLRTIAHSVVRFDSPAQLGARLDALGLAAVLPPPAQPYVGWDVQRTLEERGRVLSFDSETDRSPNDHDALLAELATLGGDALADVAFRERAPSEDAADTAPYVVDAFASGRAYRIEARNYGDYYDVEAVLGFLDALARDRHRDERWTSLETGDQMAIVAAGPGASLDALVRDGLLARGSASAARESGQGAEERFFGGQQRDDGETE